MNLSFNRLVLLAGSLWISACTPNQGDVEPELISFTRGDEIGGNYDEEIGMVVLTMAGVSVGDFENVPDLGKPCQMDQALAAMRMVQKV